MLVPADVHGLPALAGRELHKRSPREYATAKGLSKAWSMAEYSFDRCARVCHCHSPLLLQSTYGRCAVIVSWPGWQSPTCRSS